MNPYEQEIKDRKDKARAVVSITSGGRRLCRQVMARSEAERRINSYDDLLAALKGCAAVLDAVLNGNGTDARDTDIALTIANRAILKATGTDTTTTGGK